MTLRVFTGVVVLAATAAGAPAAVAGEPPIVSPTQELATLSRAHKVMTGLHPRRSNGSHIGATRPITGSQTVLPVVGKTTTADGVRWLRVMLPGRPNGRRGWITRRGTALRSTSWHIVVKTSSRRVRAYRRGRLERSFAAIVGTPATPTPHGRFFVEESVRMLLGSSGGPYALALSARSNVLQEFEGGPGQIAMHGVANLSGTLGTAASHGCVRVASESTRWLAARIAPGVPVTIRR